MNLVAVWSGPAAAADDDAPRCSNRSPPPDSDAGVAARFEDAAFDFTKWDIYSDGNLPMDRFRLSGRGRGRVKQMAVRFQPHQVRRPAPRLVATGQLEMPLEDLADRPAKNLARNLSM